MQEYVDNDFGQVYFQLGREHMLVSVQAMGSDVFALRVADDNNDDCFEDEYHLLLATHDDDALVSIMVSTENDWDKHYEHTFEGEWMFWFNGDEIVATKVAR